MENFVLGIFLFNIVDRDVMNTYGKTQSASNPFGKQRGSEFFKNKFVF